MPQILAVHGYFSSVMIRELVAAGEGARRHADSLSGGSSPGEGAGAYKSGRWS